MKKGHKPIILYIIHPRKNIYTYKHKYLLVLYYQFLLINMAYKIFLIIYNIILHILYEFKK